MRGALRQPPLTPLPAGAHETSLRQSSDHPPPRHQRPGWLQGARGCREGGGGLPVACASSRLGSCSAQLPGATLTKAEPLAAQPPLLALQPQRRTVAPQRRQYNRTYSSTIVGWDCANENLAYSHCSKNRPPWKNQLESRGGFSRLLYNFQDFRLHIAGEQ